MALFVRPIMLLLAFSVPGVLAACTGSPAAPQNPLFGDWSMELPTTPRMHGNEIAFHPDCVIASGNLVDSRVVQPARFLKQDGQTYVWYGPATETATLYLDQAARVVFLSPDRIEVAWPEGFSANYRRAIFAQSSNADCRFP